MRICWCGNADLLPFSSAYGECRACGTLVSLSCNESEQSKVQNDQFDFYGKRYWLDHQTSDLGHPDIYARARNDLIERNLHWLKTLLKYRLPSARVLELGCAHGSFVALLRLAGYEASGVEMSPWVVEFGQKIFDVPIFVGPVETLDFPDGSFDVIALMDVLEHLFDPCETMAHCLKLLKPDGFLLIQTPQFRSGMEFKELVKTRSTFLSLLEPDEHIYLFTDKSVTQFFRKLGTEHIRFEPAIFSHYDMFFTVSRMPLKGHDLEAVETALKATPNGRIVLALLDIRERELDVTRKLSESEVDRAARLEIMHRLEDRINKLIEELTEEKQKAGELEQGWRELENTFIVRQARRIGLVKAGKCAED
jgi:2-polyprenyl-3-methyl-5-hydroxy-6-metoxy-1,4-benzoquinol methylase